MNVGIDVIANSYSTTYIGVVKSVSRIEESPVLDKLGDQLKPFEILFNVGDIITGARAAPLAVFTEIKPGDAVIIYSMESIYSNTFFYNHIRNLNDPEDSIRLNYNNASVEIKPTTSGNADILINAGNNLITVDSEEGTISLDTLNGVRINGGTNTIEIRNDSHSLHELVKNLIDEVSNIKVITPSGTGTLDPTSISKLLQIGLNFDDLLGEVTKSEYYPVVPRNELSRENIEDLVRDLGLDILSDEEVYIKGSNPVIDEARSEFEGEVEDETEVIEPTEIETQPNTSVPVDPDCPLGPIKSSTMLSENFDIASLTTKTTYPHRLVPLNKSYTDKKGRVVDVNMTVEEIACNLKALAHNILEPIKAQFPDMYITSCIRTNNTSSNGLSQHLKGEAVDLQFRGIPPSGYVPIAKWITENLPYDQIIFEHSTKGSIWLHVSYVRGRPGRRSQLTMLKNKYMQGLKLFYA